MGCLSRSEILVRGAGRLVDNSHPMFWSAMKLARVGQPVAEVPVVVHGDGRPAVRPAAEPYPPPGVPVEPDLDGQRHPVGAA